MEKFLIAGVIGFILIASGYDSFVTAQVGDIERIRGQNYDIINDYTNGVGYFTTTNERIQVGTDWLDYFTMEKDNKFYYYSNQIGTLILSLIHI